MNHPYTACPSDDVLAALMQRALAPDERELVTAHLDGCATCQQIVIAAVRAGIAASRPDVATSLPVLTAISPSAAVAMRFGRYELRALLGIGGMGAVYEAYDAELDRAVALKVLRPELCGTPDFADRLIMESRLMAKIAHPEVISVYDAGRDGNIVFIAMELIRGSTLTAWLAVHELPWPAIVALFERAGHGLAAAHGAGIVHRDFKPDNVLVSRDGDKVVVTDFGIAREAARTWSITETPTIDATWPQLTSARGGTPITTEGAVIGTPAYMAPEQFEGRAVDHRADVFAFSVSLWEALFQARPFHGITAGDIHTAMQRPPVPPPGAVQIPRRLLRALRRGLAIEPADRWPDMPALLAELAAIRARRRRSWLAAGATALLAIALAAAFVARRASAVDPCEAALESLAAAYNPRLEAQVSAALVGEPAIRSAVLAKLGATADAWRTAHRATCHAERDAVQAPTTAACLDARRLELAGSVDDLISNGPAGARYAGQISEIPGAPAACAHPAPGLLFAQLPADRERRRDVTALRARLFDVDELRMRGEFRRAVDDAQRVVTAAAAVWPPLHAEALFALGTLQSKTGDSKLAAVTLRDAAAAAERAHDDDIAARSWTELALGMVADHVNHARALEYVSYAEAAADRIGRPTRVLAHLQYVKGIALLIADRYSDSESVLRNAVELAATTSSDDLTAALQGLGQLYEKQGRFADAVAIFRKEIEQLPRSPAGEIIGSPVPFERLAANLSQLGQSAQAETEMRRAVEIADRTLPETQLGRPFAHQLLANLLQYAGHYDEALTEITGALAGFAKIMGVRSQHYGGALSVRGEIMNQLGRYREAEALLARACEIVAFTSGDDSAYYARCEGRHCTALAGLGRDAEVLPRADHIVAILDKIHDAPSPEVADAFVRRGTAHAALHHHRAAIADLERAVAIAQNVRSEPGILASAQWRLGKELWTDQPQRARAQLAAALALFETTDASWSGERREAAAWLASHSPSRGRAR